MALVHKLKTLHSAVRRKTKPSELILIEPKVIAFDRMRAQILEPFKINARLLNNGEFAILVDDRGLALALVEFDSDGFQLTPYDGLQHHPLLAQVTRAIAKIATNVKVDEAEEH